MVAELEVGDSLYALGPSVKFIDRRITVTDDLTDSHIKYRCVGAFTYVIVLMPKFAHRHSCRNQELLTPAAHLPPNHSITDSRAAKCSCGIGTNARPKTHQLDNATSARDAS